MQLLNLNDVNEYIQANIGDFHQRREEGLGKLKLHDVLKKKNPYLFRAKNVPAPDLVKGLLDAHLSSQEEGIFGDFLEGLAIFVCKNVFNGRKSAAEGIDLEFERDGALYIVSVKSGPNWGNSSQVKRMKENFTQAKRILRARNKNANIVAVNGCCYGRDTKPDKGEYLKICGQEFWTLISSNDHLYIDIVYPLNHEAKKRSEEFAERYAVVLNLFIEEFLRDFCAQGKIDWEKLVEFNSGKKK